MDQDQYIRDKNLSGFIARALNPMFFAFLAMVALLVPTTAHAQVTQYTNSTDGTINESVTPCTVGGYLVRNFSVGTSYTVSDVDIGVLLAHTYRGDLLMYLSSPAGTRVQIFTGTGGGADNFNVLMDSALGTSVTTHSAADTATAATTVPPYQRNFSPANSLNAFNGQNSAGTWTLEVCDRFGGDAGTFYEADLFLAQVPTNYADLSLTKAVSNATPANGASINYTLQVTNASSSPNTATGVVVRDLLPAGTTFVSSSGFGTYNSATGDWTISSIAPNQTRTLTITATVNATSGATVTNIAEIIASSHVDIDSTVNNGATGEDDYATRSFTVSGTRVAGTPPNLGTICSPTNQLTFDWDGQTWAAGSLINNYTITGLGTVNYTLTTDITFVAGSPTLNTTNTGGFGAGQQSLFLNMNNNFVSDTSTTILSLPTAVPGLQFTMFDIDFGAGQWADKVTVTGTYNGTSVIPTLTNNIANYVVGNTAIGDGGSSGDQANGNVVVTFLSPVDTITIVYGNHTTAPTNPGNQFMNIYDFTYCSPVTTLSVTKISQVLSDPFNGTTNPKAIPGATMQYCLLMTNSGSGTAGAVTATDDLTGQPFTYIAESMRSGTNCGSAATVEDDDATAEGGDESDPFGASITSDIITAVAANLGPAESFALTFQVTVD